MSKVLCACMPETIQISRFNDLLITDRCKKTVLTLHKNFYQKLSISHIKSQNPRDQWPWNWIHNCHKNVESNSSSIAVFHVFVTIMDPWPLDMLKKYIMVLDFLQQGTKWCMMPLECNPTQKIWKFCCASACGLCTFYLIFWDINWLPTENSNSWLNFLSLRDYF